MTAKNFRPSIIARHLLVGVVLLGSSLIPARVAAGEILDRSVSLSTSEAQAQANYTFNLTVPSATPIRSFVAEVCETAAGTCNAPAGFSAGSATLLNQPTGFGQSSGWSVDTSNSDLIRMNHASNATAPGVSQAVSFGNITNPSATNTTFFLRITTYANTSYTDAIDDGVVAVSTAEGISITGFVPPILTFCVGITIPGNCTTATGNSINLGTFSPNTTASATSQMQASTNAGDGYAITVAGTTLSSGSNTIAAMGAQAASQIGVSQFGINLRNNSNPNVGSDPTGSGSGSNAANYNTANQFRYVAGDILASAPGPTNSNTYTVSYITNIEPSQAAGNYSTTLTYIATATF